MDIVLPRALSIFIVLVALNSMDLAVGKVDPTTGHIRILCIGESYYPDTPLPLILRADPRVRYYPIPASFRVRLGGKEEVLKLMRQYMPRTYEQLIGLYDVILMSDFEVDILTDEQLQWMEECVGQGGIGIGKYEMNWDPTYFKTFDLFVASPLYRVFPADLLPGRSIPRPLDGIYPVSLPGTGRPHPMLDLPEIRNYKLLGPGDYGYEIPRAGATVVAKFRPKDEDAMIIWAYGNGRSLTSLPGLDKIDGDSLVQWPYAVDFWTNQVWYLAALEIPRDVGLLHQLREMSLGYLSARVLATSVIEFAEKFGASTLPVYEELARVDTTKAEADRLYLEGSYQESLEKMEEAFDGLGRVSRDSMRMREKALFWIYLVEWFVVTGTSMIAGFALWSLMVRRRLYREVAVTRLR